MRPAELITACYARLNVPAVTDLLTQDYGVPAIFQRGKVPQEKAGESGFFPYISFRIVSDADFSTKQSLGGSAVIQIDVWDRSGSAVALGGIMRAALQAVVRQDWTVPGFITCDREMLEQIDDPDGVTMHGVIRVRVQYLE